MVTRGGLEEQQDKEAFTGKNVNSPSSVLLVLKLIYFGT